MSMLLRARLKTWLVVSLVVSMTLVGLVPRAAIAMVIPSVSSGGPAEPQRDRDLQKIQVALESKVVAQRLQNLGLTAEEIQAKMSQFSDDQIHQVAQNVDELSAGSAHVLLIAIAVVVGAVLFFLLFAGHT